MSKIAVIGGGAAGMIAAIRAAERGHDVTLYEKNEKLGKKVYITGKGRCNVTNACDAEEFFEHVTGNAKFFYSAFYGFDNRRVMELIEKAGCPLKTERGNRVFPVSDHSSDVIKVLRQTLERLGCEIRYNTAIKGLLAEEYAEDVTTSDTADVSWEMQDAGDECRETKASKKAKKKNKYEQQITGVLTATGKKEWYDSVILATGGVSYPSTGSTGDGHKFAKDLGLKVTELKPSLVPFEVKEKWCGQLQGLALKNVTATLFVDGKKVFSQMGELLFTHFGVSGPLILTASSVLAQKKNYNDVMLTIDLKPALTEEQLDKRFLKEFEEGHNKQLKNILPALYPSSLASMIPELADVDESKPAHSITREERERLVRTTKALSLTVTGTRGFAEAIITSGGVDLKEVNPSTMECKRIKGLYIAGELLNLDAHTGGYNLQIAWSTGYLAGDCAE
ncbi:MAG: NAD(P)/FAD-dependent oxidoreductase [Lachnospiraceae bacterium]|nr:NAD(P)/FAD-dependent oxidoreductase [Lachnospiraceae bacterium]